YAQQEYPQTFSQELFAMPVAVSSGLTLTDYQAATSQVEPVRLALLLIAAKKEGGIPLAAFVTELTNTLKEGKSILPVIHQWELSLRPPVTPSKTEGLPFLIHVLSEGFGQFKKDSKEALLLGALTPQEGLLPDASWQAVPDAGIEAIQGSLMMLGAYPP